MMHSGCTNTAENWANFSVPTVVSSSGINDDDIHPFDSSFSDPFLSLTEVQEEDHPSDDWMDKLIPTQRSAASTLPSRTHTPVMSLPTNPRDGDTENNYYQMCYNQAASRQAEVQHLTNEEWMVLRQRRERRQRQIRRQVELERGTADNLPIHGQVLGVLTRTAEGVQQLTPTAVERLAQEREVLMTNMSTPVAGEVVAGSTVHNGTHRRDGARRMPTRSEAHRERLHHIFASTTKRCWKVIQFPFRIMSSTRDTQERRREEWVDRQVATIVQRELFAEAALSGEGWHYGQGSQRDDSSEDGTAYFSTGTAVASDWSAPLPVNDSPSGQFSSTQELSIEGDHRMPGSFLETILQQIENDNQTFTVAQPERMLRRGGLVDTNRDMVESIRSIELMAGLLEE